MTDSTPIPLWILAAEGTLLTVQNLPLWFAAWLVIGTAVAALFGQCAKRMRG